MTALNRAGSFVATLLAAPRGISSRPASRQPVQTLALYEMENCPYCRVVREALTLLDLDAMIYPCPKNGSRFRKTVIEKGGKAMFPYLVDPNTGVAMYESAEIIQYLYRNYGERAAPPKALLKVVNTTASMLVSAARHRHGLYAQAAAAPAEPLELFGFESSPYARLVRDKLCELEIPYLMRNMGRTGLGDWLLPPVRARLMPNYTPGGRNRSLLLQRTGKVASPWLYDPNTDTGLFESGDIIDYLDNHYAGRV